MSDVQAGRLLKALVGVAQGQDIESFSKFIQTPLKAILTTPEAKPARQMKLVEVSDEIKEEAEKFLKWLPTVMGYSSELRDLGRNSKKQANYIECYRKLRLNYSKKEIVEAITFAVNDDFWRNNFLSPTKLLKVQKSSDSQYISVFLSQATIKNHDKKKAREAAGFRD